MIEINFEQVNRLGDTLKALELSDNFSDYMIPASNADRETLLSAYLWTAAICHSTKGGMKGKFNGKAYKGWDYLLRSFCSAADKNPESVSIASITRITADDLYTILNTYADDASVTLEDLDRRAEILADCANEITALFGGRISTMLDLSNNKVGGPNGAYAQLEKLSPFQAELKKKSSAFLMNVHFSKLWQISDPENIEPMIDYHKMRTLCRSGCIEIKDCDLLAMLINKEIVSPEIEFRMQEISKDIFKYLCTYTRIPIYDFDALLWGHARSCCRYKPVCISGVTEDDSFYDYLKKDFTGGCEFAGWCKGSTQENYRAIWEPMIKTEDY